MTENVIRGDWAHCPYCGYGTDAATDVYGAATPTAGDWSICFGCGRVGRFTGVGLLTRAITADEEAEALADAAVVKARGAVLAFIADREP